MADNLTEDQEKQLLEAFHQRVMEDISFKEAVQIVSNVAADKLSQELKSMSEEEKTQAYKDLNLK
jgi:Mg/Co/Ni transporter MgtE